MKTDKPNPQKKPSQKPNQAKEYIKYSGLAFQMIAVILAGYWIGRKLDEWLQTNMVFTVLSILVAIIGSIALLIINALKSK